MGNLLADQSIEAKELMAFLNDISVTLSGKNIATIMEAGQLWYRCTMKVDEHDDDEIAQRFKTLSEAWLNRR